MTTIRLKSGETYEVSTYRISTGLKKKARSLGINITQTLRIALEQSIEQLEKNKGRVV